jgi:uncharacterized protein
MRSPSRDPNDVFVIDVGDVMKVPGVRHHVVLAGPLPGIALPSAGVPEDADVHVDTTVERQGTNVIVEGVARTRWVGKCRRCLGQTAGDLEVAFHEIFERRPVHDVLAPPGSADDETFFLDDDELDLRPMLIGVIVLELPLAPLCSDDCAGPAPHSHPVHTPDEESGEANGSPGRDPRWAPLDQIRFD